MNVLFFWGCAVLAVGILITFSITNHRAGWKETESRPQTYSTTVAPLPEQKQATPSASVTLTSGQPMEFSSQLLNLSAALSSSTPVQLQSEPVHLQSEMTASEAGRI
jgi:hypothetical protein